MRFAGWTLLQGCIAIVVTLCFSVVVGCSGNEPKGNAKVGSYINLGVMKNTTGTQTYQLPQGKTSTGYKAVVIWCQRFGANFGYATLK